MRGRNIKTLINVILILGAGTPGAALAAGSSPMPLPSMSRHCPPGDLQCRVDTATKKITSLAGGCDRDNCGVLDEPAPAGAEGAPTGSVNSAPDLSTGASTRTKSKR